MIVNHFVDVNKNGQKSGGIRFLISASKAAELAEREREIVDGLG